MKITWQVEDGYVGKGSPQYTHIEKSELDDYGTLEQKREFIYECIQADFEQNISWALACNVDALLKETP